MDADSKKKAAALAALEYVEDGMTIGVGTGSTVNHFIAALKDRRNRVAGAVSSSEVSTRLLQEAGIEVRSLNDTGDLSLYVDGADEATRHLALIKGGGGQSPLPLHRGRCESRGRARAISPPCRGHSHGPLAGRAQARRHRGATRPVHGFQDRQRQ